MNNKRIQGTNIDRDILMKRKEVINLILYVCIQNNMTNGTLNLFFIKWSYIFIIMDNWQIKFILNKYHSVIINTYTNEKLKISLKQKNMYFEINI